MIVLSTVYVIVLAFSIQLQVCCGNDIQEINLQNKYDIFKQSNGPFSDNLIKSFGPTDNNLLISPMSLHYALSAISLGANEQSLTEIKNVCHLPDDESKMKSAFKEFTDLLKNDKNVEMFTAIFVDKEFPLTDSFHNDLTSNFDASVKSLDFKHNPEDSQVTINNFVDNKTNHLVHDLFPAGAISVDTKSVLVNTIHFKAKWIYPFDETVKSTFHGLDKDYKTDIMYLPATNLRYKNDFELKAQLLEVPYEGEYTFLIILPYEKNGLSDVLKKVELKEKQNSSSFIEIFRHAKRVKVELFLPKFKFEHTHDLKEVLKKMGLNNIFSDDADFSRLSSMPVKVSNIIQKTFINVDEKFTEAGAATGIQFSPRNGRIFKNIVNADHPFIYAIFHKATESLLFVGKFVKP
ncbi:serine protease inhibitor-like isoform X2 [Lycorma delicatula]|uniref:serine protease inhibitor-like isoform X2 n=1 Tax=Lycorma delicatula TaxID=130591 RepID=UPI003F516FF0